MEEKLYDVFIIGAGPAALTAGVYAARYGMSCICVGQTPGGQMAEATTVHNWPGEQEITGSDLHKKMYETALHNDVEVKIDRVVDAKKHDNYFSIATSFSGEFLAKTIIIATGAEHKKLSLPSEEKYAGKGVAYCATCDGPLYKGKTVAVVGSGNSAVGSAVYLSDICKKVYVLSREKEFNAEYVTVEQIKNASNIEIKYETEVKEIKGNGRVSSVLLTTGEEIEVDGIFVEIGSAPVRELMDKIGVATTKAGYIEVDNAKKTNIEGVFAAGDVTNGNNMFKQIVCAVSDGAIAANSAFSFVKKMKS